MPKVVLATDDPPARLPAWARGLDALAIVTLVLSIFLILFGGFVVHLPGLRVSVHSPARVLFIAAAAIAIRHATVPALPLHVRILRRLRAARSDSPGVIASAALASRVAVLLVGYFAVLTIGFSPNQVGFEATGDPLLNLPARFDAGWYGGIALEGYHFQGRFDRQQNVAFFPAVPLLTRAAGHLVGAFAPGVPMGVRMARALWAGVVISMIAFVWAAVYLVRLARDSIGDIYAPAAVALLSAYPFAVFFSAPYTEGVFLLTAVGAFYHFRRRDWWIAATWGLLAGSTRPNGCLLSVALACLLL
jgi:Gpi18-like mannosyltransferase